MARKQRRRPLSAPAVVAARGSARVRVWIVLALVVATVLAYVPALRAPFVIDDETTITASADWKSAPGSPAAGRPLVLATLAANAALNQALGVDQRRDPDGPNKAVGYRLFNLLVHLLTGALLFGVVRRAVREQRIPGDWRAIADPIAAAVCALWLLHPIQSEVINYIVQRSEGLASLFYLGVLYSSQRAWDAANSARIRWYALAVTCCVLGMMSKEIAISAPLAVMLYDRAFRLPSWRALRQPGDGRGWLYVAMWIASIGSFVAFSAGARAESAGFGSGMTWYAYFYTQCWAIAHYLRLAAWPNALSIDYGYRTISGARGIPGLILLTVFAITVTMAWARVERFGWFAFTGSLFFMLLAPSSSVVPVLLEVAAERRIYLALAAVLVLAVVGAEWLRRRFAPSISARSLAAGVAGVALVLAITTATRSRTYDSAEALWRSAVKAVPDNSRALGQLGVSLFNPPARQLAAAESAFAKAFQLDPSCPGKCLEYGTLLSNEGRYAEAAPLLERHLALDKGNRFAERLLALDFMKLGDFNRAVPLLEDVVQQAPTESHLVMLGVAYLSAGRRDQAVATFHIMASYDPGNAELQRLSEKLVDGVSHPEALANMQEFAFTMARGWM